MQRKRWENKNVLITGINGFLGSGLAESLKKSGANVFGIVRDGIKKSNYEKYNIIKGNIEDQFFLNRVINQYQVNVCFHLAAQAIVTLWESNPAEVFRTNISGTWNILEACRNSKTIEAVIVASSDKVYGNQKKLPYTESMILKGNHYYDISKICSEHIANCYNKHYGLPVGITRCANLYGPGDTHFSRIIPGSILNLLRGEDIIIRGNGENVRDYLYIDDAVKGYIMLAQKICDGFFHAETFNFGTNLPLTVKNLVEKIIVAFKAIYPDSTKKYKLLGQDISKEIDRQYLSYKKAKDHLSWGPEVHIDEGLKRSIDWYGKLFIEYQGEKNIDEFY